MTDPASAIALVSAGSNIEPEKNIISALELLMEQVTVTASSTFYRTQAIGRLDQPDFINGIFLIKTSLTPLDFKFEVLRYVENSLCRSRPKDKFAPRTIDLDLLLYNDTVTVSPNLTLPHPDLMRPFVHVPSLELLRQFALENPVLATAMKKFLHPLPTSQSPGVVLEDFTNLLRSKIREHKA